MDAAETREAARAAIAQAGMELDDDELEQVTGGSGHHLFGSNLSEAAEETETYCPYCHREHLAGVVGSNSGSGFTERCRCCLITYRNFYVRISGNGRQGSKTTYYDERHVEIPSP